MRIQWNLNTQPYDKQTKVAKPTENRKVKWQYTTNIKIVDYITVGSTTAIQLVWYNQFMWSQPTLFSQKICNQKDSHLKICKWSSL